MASKKKVITNILGGLTAGATAGAVPVVMSDGNPLVQAIITAAVTILALFLKSPRQ